MELRGWVSVVPPAKLQDATDNDGDGDGEITGAAGCTESNGKERQREGEFAVTGPVRGHGIVAPAKSRHVQRCGG